MHKSIGRWGNLVLPRLLQSFLVSLTQQLDYNNYLWRISNLGKTHFLLEKKFLGISSECQFLAGSARAGRNIEVHYVPLMPPRDFQRGDSETRVTSPQQGNPRLFQV